jgi:hypothetical protein
MIYGAIVEFGAWIYMEFGMSIRMDYEELSGMKM